jgi:hypothetical protein
MGTVSITQNLSVVSPVVKIIISEKGTTACAGIIGVKVCISDQENSLCVGQTPLRLCVNLSNIFVKTPHANTIVPQKRFSNKRHLE